MSNWAHQAREWQIGREKRARYLIWPMRSGKSKACIDKAVYQHKRGTIEGVIVIAPNGVHLNWANLEIPKWGHGAVFAWETTKRSDPARIAEWELFNRSSDLKWLCVNMEALKHLDCRQAVRKFLVSCHRKFMLIVSEGHHFGRPGSKRTFMARSLALHAAFRTVESGTPVLNSPLRAFSQFEILAPGALGYHRFTDFEKRYAEYESHGDVNAAQDERRFTRRRYRKLKQYVNLEELGERMAKWSSVVKREDLQDMPDLIRTERHVVMSDKQRHVYLEMAARHLAEIGDDLITSKDAGARMQKLQQVCNGYMITEDGRIASIEDEAPIYTALLDEIEGTLPGKSLVWCRYREDIRRVCAVLRKRGWGYVEYHGGIDDIHFREAFRHKFNTDSRTLVCVGQPAAGGEGRDFSGADAVIFFSAVPNAIQIAQAEERATVKGGRTVAIVRMRTPGTVDDRLWQIVDNNAATSDTLSGHVLRDLLRGTDL